MSKQNLVSNVAAPPKRARKKVAPASKPEPVPKPKTDLKPAQVKVLLALADGESLTRKEIAEQSKVDNASLTGYLGSTDLEIREKNDTHFYPCLITLKLVKELRTDEGGRNVTRYMLTGLGRNKVKKFQ